MKIRVGQHPGMVGQHDPEWWVNMIRNIQMPPNPLDAIRFRLDQMNMSEADLSEILGARSRKSEIFSGKRKLSLSMIRKLKEKLNIPAEILIRAY